MPSVLPRGSCCAPCPDITGPQGEQGIQGETGPIAVLTHSVLAYAASVVIDFDLDAYRTVTLAGDIAFTTANLADALTVSVRIVGDGSLRTLTFPAGWTFVGFMPTELAANKVGVLTVTALGATDADVVAAYSAKT